MAPRRKRQAEAGQGPSRSPEPENESPLHQLAFLQVLMHRQYMAEHDAKEIYRRITGAAGGASDGGYLDFLGQVNKKLSFSHFELRGVKYPGDHTYYIGFVNKEADEESKRALKYRSGGKPDLRVTAFFRLLLERIATADNADGGLGYIKSGEALNAYIPSATQQPAAMQNGEPAATQAAPIGNLSMKDRQDVLDQLVFDGWLAHTSSPPGAYSLGPRTFLELGSYMLELDLPADTRQALEAIL